MQGVDTRLAEIVQRACVALFSDYSVSIEPRPESSHPSQDLAYFGIIGFTGTDMRGSLMLGCSLKPLLRLAQDDNEIAMRDWLAELTNQLLGRVKNRLSACGTELHMSTPVVLGGSRIAPITAQPSGQQFTVHGGALSVWFDVIVRPGFELSSADDSAILNEGSALLF